MATKKKTPAKKVAAKRATPKKTVVRKQAAADQAFKVVREKTPFLTFKVTEQTVYWAILFIYVFALSLWVLRIQLDILDIVNQIN